MLITLGRHSISYEAHGEGVPLLLMHAFPLDQTMFEGQASALADVARVFTFDLPGVGSSAAAAVSLEDAADLAAALLTTQKIERAIVGGVSMGGYAAFAFARRHPLRLRGLILADTKPAADSEEAKKARAEMATVARQQGAAEIANRMLPRLLSEATHHEQPEVVAKVRRMIEGVPPETIAQLLDALANRRDSTDLLPRIAVPTLVMTGEHDPIAPPAEASEWSQSIPGARFVPVPGAGHLANLEKPDLFHAAVREFLESAVRHRGYASA